MLLLAYDLTKNRQKVNWLTSNSFLKDYQMSYADKFKNEIKSFYPAYFALVMATGIISSACLQLHYKLLAAGFFILNNVQYVILLLLLIARIVFFYASFKTDLITHSKGAGFLSFVAASCILATGYVQAHNIFSVGIVLLIISVVVWLFIVYSFLSAIILKKEKPSLNEGINGSWLLLVVSTQSIVILVSLLASEAGLRSHIILFLAVIGWLISIVLYFIIVTLIMNRLAFFPVSPPDISPSYWIDTGAAAITALAGLTLSGSVKDLVNYQQYLPVINLLSLLMWSAATFWLPLLFILEIWRHFKSGFKYVPDYWSLVFPLGMYTVATLKVASAFQMPFLNSVAHVFIILAITAWLVTFIAMLINFFQTLSTAKA